VTGPHRHVPVSSRQQLGSHILKWTGYFEDQSSTTTWLSLLHCLQLWGKQRGKERNGNVGKVT
jgi:hypothetical protein